LILQGLKDLHQKFTQNNTKYGFQNEKDQCLQSLKELFLHRIKENREKRLRMNQTGVKAIRDVPRALWVTKILVYLELDECLKLSQVCVFFNQMIKSPMFIKHYVTLREKTKVDVRPNHFDTR
jgi:hypothetical protein